MSNELAHRTAHKHLLKLTTMPLTKHIESFDEWFLGCADTDEVMKKLLNSIKRDAIDVNLKAGEDTYLVRVKHEALFDTDFVQVTVIEEPEEDDCIEQKTFAFTVRGMREALYWTRGYAKDVSQGFCPCDRGVKTRPIWSAYAATVFVMVSFWGGFQGAT